jgi:hypothetical protein
LMMEAVHTSEMVCFSETTRCYIQEVCHLHTHYCKNLKSCQSSFVHLCALKYYVTNPVILSGYILLHCVSLITVGLIY